MTWPVLARTWPDGRSITSRRSNQRGFVEVRGRRPSQPDRWPKVGFNLLVLVEW